MNGVFRVDFSAVFFEKRVWSIFPIISGLLLSMSLEMSHI